MAAKNSLERLLLSPFVYRTDESGSKKWNMDYEEGGHYYDPIYGDKVVEFDAKSDIYSREMKMFFLCFYQKVILIRAKGSYQRIDLLKKKQNDFLCVYLKIGNESIDFRRTYHNMCTMSSGKHNPRTTRHYRFLR